MVKKPRRVATRKTRIDAPQPRDSLGYLLWQVHHHWQRHLEQHLRDLNLTHMQSSLLNATNYLHSRGEIPTQARLASYSKFDPMMVSKALRLLEKKGLLKRRPQPPANLITLTDKGRTMLKRALVLKSKALKEFFGPLGADQKSLSRLFHLLLEHHSD